MTPGRKQKHITSPIFRFNFIRCITNWGQKLIIRFREPFHFHKRHRFRESAPERSAAPRFVIHSISFSLKEACYQGEGLCFLKESSGPSCLIQKKQETQFLWSPVFYWVTDYLFTQHKPCNLRFLIRNKTGHIQSFL